MDRINLEELQKAVSWFTDNGSVRSITVESHPGFIMMRGFDRDNRAVSIKLCYVDKQDQPNMKAQITKTEVLQ